MKQQQWHSGFDDSSGWGRMIDPVCLFILCQIAGTLWVMAPRKTFAAPVAPSVAVDTHRSEVAGLMGRKSALEKAVKMARQELSTLALPVEQEVTERDRIAAEIRLEEQEIKELEARLAEAQKKKSDLETKLAAPPPPNPQAASDSERLASQLAAKEAEIARLQVQLASTAGPGEGAGIGSPRLVETNLEPRTVHLIGGRAVPVDAEHYSFEMAHLRTTNEQVIVAKKKAAGETVEQLQQPKSDLQAFLKKMDPSKQFLFCLVTSDSLAIYREVKKRAQGMGIKVAWTTNYDSDGVLVASAKGSNQKLKIPEGK